MKNHAILINSITCNNASEDNITDGDEVYIDCQADGGLAIRIPQGANESHNMEGGDVWSPGGNTALQLNFNYEVLLTIWDHDVHDDPNTATFLVNKDFEPGSGSGTITLENEDSASYTISYTYLN